MLFRSVFESKIVDGSVYYIVNGTPSGLPTPTGTATSTSAAFVQGDSPTKGTWNRAYGRDGYNTIWDVTHYSDLKLTDNVPHRGALYCLDLDHNLRAQSLDIVDALTESLLSRSVSSLALFWSCLNSS